MNITLTWFEVDDDGKETELTEIFPSKNTVCPDCEGVGSTLVQSIREHAYSQEEFEESFFDEEDRLAYFTPKSKYHETCRTCNGENVIPVVDEEHLSDKQKPLFASWSKSEERRQRDDYEDRMTMRMENGGYDG